MVWGAEMPEAEGVEDRQLLGQRVVVEEGELKIRERAYERSIWEILGLSRLFLRVFGFARYWRLFQMMIADTRDNIEGYILLVPP